ncbi:collagen, type I, alpha 1a-like [Penaeus vannamei]|uniref:collagen, type I, alpha 1a-like n=1 Tax=Penaeus vannamei TaxID=6689 RepID=UPI00387F93AD
MGGPCTAGTGGRAGSDGGRSSSSCGIEVGVAPCRPQPRQSPCRCRRRPSATHDRAQGPPLPVRPGQRPVGGAAGPLSNPTPPPSAREGARGRWGEAPANPCSKEDEAGRPGQARARRPRPERARGVRRGREKPKPSPGQPRKTWLNGLAGQAARPLSWRRRPSSNTTRDRAFHSSGRSGSLAGTRGDHPRRGGRDSVLLETVHQRPPRPGVLQAMVEMCLFANFVLEDIFLVPGPPKACPAFGDGSRRGRGFITAAVATPAPADAASALGLRGRRGQKSPSRLPGGRGPTSRMPPHRPRKAPDRPRRRACPPARQLAASEGGSPL